MSYRLLRRSKFKKIKMSIQKIITIEDRNTGEIHLHKEGIFWKAYQQSAYLFTQEVKIFKTSKRIVKSLSREIISLGFPQNALEKYFNFDDLQLPGQRHEGQVALSGCRLSQQQQWGAQQCGQKRVQPELQQWQCEPDEQQSGERVLSSLHQRIRALVARCSIIYGSVNLITLYKR
jgi:hypothetical protein